MQLSLLPGKPVFSREGKELGYVKCAYICKNQRDLACLVCVDGEEEEFILPAKELTFSDDKVSAGKARLKAPLGLPCPVGKAVFDREGRFLGRCNGYDTDGTLSVWNGSAQTLPAARICLGDAVIAAFPSQREKKTARTAQNAIRVDKKEKRTDDVASGREEFGVLGRQVKKPVEGVAAPGETVTPATLKRARENNKLLELAANTLTQ